jgi:hypothetical protein
MNLNQNFAREDLVGRSRERSILQMFRVVKFVTSASRFFVNGISSASLQVKSVVVLDDQVYENREAKPYDFVGSDSHLCIMLLFLFQNGLLQTQCK